jgi:hypothetical protein
MLYLVYGCPRPAGPLLFFTELRDRDRDAYSEPTAIAGHAVGKCTAIHTELRDRDRDAYSEPTAIAGHAVVLSRIAPNRLKA